MADYSKKKNEELIALCKERGLPHTGKKADFVKRLEDDDAKQSITGPASAASAKPPIEDEIDWDDEPANDTAKAATTTQAAKAIAAGGIGEVPNPVAVPNQVLAEDPAKTDDLTVAAAPAANGEAAAEEPVPAKDFTSGISERTIDEEIEKRKARARKYGLPEDSDEIKMLERAKKYGVQDASAVPGMLNKALSEGRERKRALDAPLSEGGVRKRSRGPRRGGAAGAGAGGSRQASGKPSEKKENGATWMSDVDRQKAEARKAKFAAPA
ncbi:hypothetical protein BAUCODRAFT_554568 [Baudoinia panamericana UAMH 10762]|uniref:SAP domain-containing protein n=1 Tax=Baudoinia panamericana (strain UAMH 10762) TaxID=717646 RepID=M2N763_BAUPA|nr:uncharacterized protein BAUCODRAFT_554568 [Baudoinia panamericana UAMH 10762]EMC94630.1 hypothetical protein BAUCODRAFT_554568 [Baudoinia panamericana UAMH 10762]